MKGPGAAAGSAAPAGKRRWRCVAAAGAAVALAFFSVVVPLAVLLGLHASFPSSACLTPRPQNPTFFLLPRGAARFPDPGVPPVPARARSECLSRLHPASNIYFDSNSVDLFGLCSVLGRRERCVGKCQLNLISCVFVVRLGLIRWLLMSPCIPNV